MNESKEFKPFIPAEKSMPDLRERHRFGHCFSSNFWRKHIWITSWYDCIASIPAKELFPWVLSV